MLTGTFKGWHWPGGVRLGSRGVANVTAFMQFVIAAIRGSEILSQVLSSPHNSPLLAAKYSGALFCFLLVEFLTPSIDVWTILCDRPDQQSRCAALLLHVRHMSFVRILVLLLITSMFNRLIVEVLVISLFPTPFDHFHFHRSGGLILWYDLRL